MDHALCFVQFIHPGGEHRPDSAGTKRWNRGRHQRKFLTCRGQCVQRGPALETDVVFWGEWEPESDVVSSFNKREDEGPRYIYRPYYVVPESYAGLQNTDPFAFDGFLYGICQQHNAGGPTQLRNLDRGSVILFGSYLAAKFVLDTVFVVSDWLDCDVSNYASILSGRVPNGYKEVTLDPLFLADQGSNPSCASNRERSFRLYSGATHASPFEGMFSFFPCMPLAECPHGFARPTIRQRGYITDDLKQGKKLNRPITPQRVKELWHSVVDQVLAQDFWLGTYASMPERRRFPRRLDFLLPEPPTPPQA